MIELYFDGACEPINPGGTAAFGWLIKHKGETIATGSSIIGSGEGMTNNVAEYQGLISGIKEFIKLDHKDKLIIYGDSDMVCKMVAKKWGWKKKKWDPHRKALHLKKLLEKIHLLLTNIDYTVEWIEREKNFEADQLSKKLLIEKGIISAELKNEKCSKCAGFLVKRTGKYGVFWGCSNYPKCTFTKRV